MNSTSSRPDRAAVEKTLFDMESATVAAFKAKDAARFTRHFDAAYVGVAGDGVKSAADEIAGMRRLDLDEIGLRDQRAVFHGDGLAILTYTMVVKGRLAGQDISGDIRASTVYLGEGGGWKAILHTESLAAGSPG